MNAMPKPPTINSFAQANKTINSWSPSEERTTENNSWWDLLEAQ